MVDTITEKQKALEYIPNETSKSGVLRGEILRGEDNVLKISSDWDDLFARAVNASVNMSHAWLGTFISEGYFKGDICFIVVWNESKLVALLPVSVQKLYGIRIAKIISSEVPTYLGLLLDPAYPDAIKVVVETWKKNKVAQVFQDKHVSSLDKVTQSLVKEFDNQGFNSAYGYKRISYGMDLGCTFEEYLEKYKSGKRRRKLAYVERQLFKNGNVKVKNYNAGDITPDILKRIAQVQEESWLKARGASVLKEPFYQKLLSNMSQAGFGYVWLMTIDGEDAAFAFNSIAHDFLYYQYVAFKLKFKSTLSIGQILLMQIIKDACDKNIKYIDFGHGEGDYKKFWSNYSRDMNWVIAGHGLAGNLMILCYKLMWFIAGQKKILSFYQRIKSLKK